MIDFEQGVRTKMCFVPCEEQLRDVEQFDELLLRIKPPCVKVNRSIAMRAKFQIQEVTATTYGQKISMCPVGAKEYGPNGENEDNDFARYTPSGELRMQINNPALDGKFKPGQNFYVDFTEAPE